MITKPHEDEQKTGEKWRDGSVRPWLKMKHEDELNKTSTTAKIT